MTGKESNHFKERKGKKRMWKKLKKRKSEGKECTSVNIFQAFQKAFLHIGKENKEKEK